MNAPLKHNYYTRVLGEASNTGLKKFRISALEYLNWINGADEEETDSMHDGSAFHMALHEPEKFATTYIEIPSRNLTSKQKKLDYASEMQDLLAVQITATGEEKADDLRDLIAKAATERGYIVLESNVLATMRGMIRSLNMPCHSLARGLVASGIKEREIRWVDSISGIPCKARIDSWDGDRGIESDLKRTEAITQHAFTRQVLNFDYHYQRAFYRRGLRANGEDVKYSCMVCGSPVAPSYHWAVYDVSNDVLDACDEKITNNLIDLAECVSSGRFSTINNGEAVTLRIKADYV